MHPTEKIHILVIEDEPKVNLSLRQGLMEAGYKVTAASSGEEGCMLVLQDMPDIVLLDLNLPGQDGLEILKILRKHNPSLIVFIITARDHINDRVLGLDTGANDYLIKPFAFPELLARIRAVTRREQYQRIMEYTVADLNVDIVGRKVRRAGQNIELTAREFEILEFLLRNNGRPVSRQTIATEVWNVQRATPIDNVIDVHIMRLRKKINLQNCIPLIHTIRGLGFMLGPDNHPAPK